MLHTLSRRIPLRKDLLPLKPHIRAPLSLDEETQVYGLLARRKVRMLGTPAGGAPPHLWEIVVSPFRFGAWWDLWNLSLRLKDNDYLTVEILHILGELGIEVVQASGAVTFSGVNDSVSFVLDCTGYGKNKIDGDHNSRRTRDRWRMRFLETLITARLSEHLRIEPDGRPSLSLRRLEAHRRIRLRLERAGLVMGGDVRSGWFNVLPTEAGTGKDGDRIQVAFSSHIASTPQTNGLRPPKAAREPDGADDKPGKRLTGIYIPAELGSALASALNRSNGASGVPKHQMSWDQYTQALASMSMFDARDMLVRSILTAGNTEMPNQSPLIKSSYLQIAMPRPVATATFLKQVFESVTANDKVATIEKYSIRSGFVQIKTLKRARSENYKPLIDRQKSRRDICRLDIVLVLKNGATIGTVASEIRENLKAAARSEDGAHPLIGVFTENDWIDRSDA